MRPIRLHPTAPRLAALDGRLPLLLGLLISLFGGSAAAPGLAMSGTLSTAIFGPVTVGSGETLEIVTDGLVTTMGPEDIAVTVEAGGNLIISGGQVTANRDQGYAIIIRGGTLTLNSGYVAAYHAVRLESGTASIFGGTITGGRTLDIVSGMASISGGELSGNVIGASVHAGTLTMTGGSVFGNLSGAVAVDSGALAISGGSLTHGSPPSYDIFVLGPGTATVEGSCLGRSGDTVTGTLEDGTAINWTVIGPVILDGEDTTPPTISCPPSKIVSAAPGQCVATVPGDLIVSGDDCSEVEVNSSRSDGKPLDDPYPVGTTTVTRTATDAAGNQASCTQTITVKDATPPTLSCPPGKTVTAAPGQCSASVPLTPPTASDTCGTPTVAGTRSDGQAISAPFPIGTTTVTWTATDAGGNQATCTQAVTVKDAQPPVISGASASPNQLWPPLLQMVPVTINYSLSDNCAGASASLSVSSNEPVTGLLDLTSPDWEIIDAHHVRLRAERRLLGSGRVYTITITATDTFGNKASQAVTVRVPLLPGG